MRDGVLEANERPQTDAEWLSVISTVQNNLDLIKKTFDRWNSTYCESATDEENTLVWYATLAAELIEKDPKKAKRIHNQVKMLCHSN